MYANVCLRTTLSNNAFVEMSESCLIIDFNFLCEEKPSNKSRKINNVIRRQETKFNLQRNKIAEANKTTD